VLDDAPWSVDFNNRLVRNDGSLRFGGRLHSGAEPAAPCEYVEDPIYHLELVLAGPEVRRDKAVRYEVVNPRLIAQGGGRINEAFYLPELRRSLRTRPVPAADHERLVRVAAASGAVVAPAGEEADEQRSDRAAAAGRGAAIEAVGAAPVLAPGEGRIVLFQVTNESTELWPAGLDSEPAIRASYHWLHRDGSVHTADGLRTGFTRDVRPGERILVPLEVYTPAQPGRYILEADLVHEHVRWFGQGCRVEVEVGERPPLPPAGPRLRESPARPRWRRRRMLIPRRLHRVWVGAAEMPDAFVEFGRGFERLHPDWEMRLWTDEDLGELGVTDDERRRARSASELSNLVRYEVLERFGGVYVDTDFEPRRPLDDLLCGVDLFAALELPGRVACGVVGAVPGHRTMERAARLSRQTLGLGLHSADANGPYFLSLLFEQEPGATIFGADKFYPYGWDEPERAAEPFPDAYAVHHWTQSWRAEPGVG
jgi:hypothetical protein